MDQGAGQAVHGLFSLQIVGTGDLDFAAFHFDRHFSGQHSFQRALGTFYRHFVIFCDLHGDTRGDHDRHFSDA